MEIRLKGLDIVMGYSIMKTVYVTVSLQPGESEVSSTTYINVNFSAATVKFAGVDSNPSRKCGSVNSSDRYIKTITGPICPISEK